MHGFIITKFQIIDYLTFLQLKFVKQKKENENVFENDFLMFKCHEEKKIPYNI